MAKTKRFYITTAIDYVNAAPHIGHAYEKVCADVIARWNRLSGKDVFFLTGTDENAQKNVLAAREAGENVKKFIDKNAEKFKELCKALGISNNDFIRTTEARHIKKSQEIFKKIYDKGDIYKGNYEGIYCEGCEAFITKRDLVDGKCPEHNKEPARIKEEAYFFRLSKYKDKILDLLRKKNFVLPEDKRKEVLTRIEQEGLIDLCVSRCKLDWGITCPADKNYKIYVWIDALVNYISGSDGNWPSDLHVIGKGINWFHSVIWPALLISAGYKLPKQIFVHGYLTINGSKISKSLGNVIDPFYIIKKYGIDSLRYFFVREIPFGQDGDFSEKALAERHNSELADKLGNLVSRVTALVEKYRIEKCENKLLEKLKLKEIEKCMENLEIDRALSLIFEFIDKCNEYVQEKKPWETHNKKILYELVDSIKALAILLYPFIPSSAEKIAKQLGFEIKNLKQIEEQLKIKKIKKGKILFEKFL